MRRGDLEQAEGVPPAAPPGRQNLPLYKQSTGLILVAEPLTMPTPEDYIDPLGAPPPSAMARLRSPSLFHTVTEHPAMISWPCSRRRVGCVGFRASGVHRNQFVDDGAARFRDV